MNLTDVFSMETALRGLTIFTAGCAVTLLMRRASAAARHHVLLCTMVAAVAIPLAAAVIPQWKVVPRWQPSPQEIAPPSEPTYPTEVESDSIPRSNEPVVRAVVRSSSPSSNPPSTDASIRIPFHKLAAFIWLGVTSLMVASSLAGMMMLRRLGKQAARCDKGPLHDKVTAISGEMGLRRAPEVLVSHHDSMPMVWGIFRHRLLLPASAVNWPEHKLRIVLLHELSHLRRHDPLALFIARLVLNFHWFNPLAWITHHQLRIEQESACDNLVLSRGITAPDYADEMLEFSSDFTPIHHLLPAPMMLRKSGLEQRIRDILSATLDRRPLSFRNAGNITLLFTLLSAPVAILGAADLLVKPAGRGRILDRNGIVLAETRGEGEPRIHPFKAMAVHLIGGSDAREKEKWGVEESYDAELLKGTDVRLTLDARIQTVVEETLRESGIGRGAVVILDPSNGDVLASASVPSFDPESVQQQTVVENLSSDPRLPLQNRAISTYQPGSTFHLVPALAAARSGHGEMRYLCEPTKFGNHQVSCWLYNKSKHSHGDQNFGQAFASGCGSYFNRLSLDVGFPQMSATAALLGLGRPTGIRIPGEQGGYYGPMNQPPEEVSRAETCFIGMGQGHAMATPLQVASMAATVANGGRVFTPRIDLSSPVSMTADLTENGIDAERIKALQIGMTELIDSYKSVSSTKVRIAGKTGTAQTQLGGIKSHNAWFTGYAPVKEPRYAIAVMIQHGGSGAGVAGPIARRILEKMIEKLPQAAAQEPNSGHMNRMEAEDVDL